ncbi:MAG TPA: M1 family aminopeptidase [Vicinamibacterales bacterium]
MRACLRVVVLLAAALTATERLPAQTGDGPAQLVLALEEALQTGEMERFDALLTPGARTEAFRVLMRGARTRAVVRERDRAPASDPGAVDMLLDTFVERGAEGYIATWRATARPGDGPAAAWRITALQRLSSVDGLYRLRLGTDAYDARGLRLSAVDFSLQMRTGLAYTAEAGGGATALVLRGRGEMIFTPPDPAERRQLELFSRSTALRVPFEEAFIRLHPGDLQNRLGVEALTPRQASESDARRAQEVFERFAGRTYTLDLQDLSRDRWSLVPAVGDLVAEVRTRKFGSLTYALSAGEAEDVTLFHRESRRNISLYTSTAQRARLGRFYSDDDRADYDIEHHDVDVRMTPAREWIEGAATVRARVRRPLSNVTLRLAESLVVRSVAAKGHGRLMHLRVIGQSNVIVTLPAPAEAGEILELDVRYGGRLTSQTLDREAAAVAAPQEMDPIVIPPVPRWIYSNRSYWYPQSPVGDFATARVRVTVPEPFDVIATGVRAGPPEPVVDPPPADPARAFTFESAQPVRYLSAVVSQFVPVASRRLDAGGAPVTLNVIASPRQAGRARDVAGQAEAIFTFYRTLLGSAPYPQLTVAVSESDLPGGHSPAYFVLLNQTLPSARITWRADPVSFENYPAFFIAHEIAHQWWGQAVGWKNYHEQWISEGFAQYFAALYAGEERGPGALGNLLRQMRRWALERTGDGPIHLGYRLGHVQGDSRVYRALVYNKAAVVLHMLRRLVGDERFFAGMRRFYEHAKFGKAGTEDFRLVMEAETGRNLEQFFEGWIYGFSVPTVRITHRVETRPGGETEVVFSAAQTGPRVFDLPVTLTIEQDDGAKRDVLLLLTEASAELRVPIDPAAGRVRRVHIDSDQAALARFDR